MVLGFATTLLLLARAVGPAAAAGTALRDGSSMLMEYALCQSEYLRVKCAADEVVLVEHARYGRMSISRCVKQDFGFVGCSVNVLSVLDTHCSGRRACSVRVLDDNFDNVKPCHDDLKSYLEVSYRCIKVIFPERQLCHTLRPIVVTNKTGYLASVVSANTGCGTGDSPWLVSLLPGQRINITLYDFSIRTDTDQNVLQSNSTSAGSDVMSGAVSEESQAKLCRVYATVRETNGARTVTICGSQLRQRPAYVTLGHMAEIRLSTAASSISDVTMTSQLTFLLKYEAVGCADVEAPAGAWVKRASAGEALFGCSDRMQTWKLRCRGDEWIGIRHNCTRAERIESITDEDALTSLSLPIGFSLVIIAALALLVGLLILAVGVVCLKRLKQGECDVIDNDVMDAAACFTLADGRSSEPRDLSTFDPFQSTLAHRFRPYAPAGYTCVTLLSPDRDELSPEPEVVVVPAPSRDCESTAASGDLTYRCAGAQCTQQEPLLQTTGCRKPLAATEHARRCIDSAVCNTCVAKQLQLQSHHTSRQVNVTADVPGHGS